MPGNGESLGRLLGSIVVGVLLSTAAAWAQVSPTSEFPAVLKDYVGAQPEGRDRLTQQNRYQAADLFHWLIHAELRQDFLDIKAIVPKGLTRDFAERADRLFGLEVFARDAAIVFGFDEDVKERRVSLLDALMTCELGAAKLLGDSTRLVEALRLFLDASQHLDRTRAFALKHGDRELLRMVEVHRVAVARTSAALRPSTISELVTALQAQSEVFIQQGLESDGRYFLAQMGLASQALRNNLDAGALTALGNARRAQAKFALPANFRAQLQSLDAEVHRRLGAQTAAKEAIRALEKLLPELAGELSTTTDARYSAMVGDWHRQVALHHADQGFHDESFRILRQALDLANLRRPDAARYRLALAAEALLIGEYPTASSEAEAVLLGIANADPAVLDADLAKQIEISARLIVAEAETRLSRPEIAKIELSQAKATLRAMRNPAPAELVASTELVEGLILASDGEFDDAIAANDRALAALKSVPNATERVHAYAAKARLYLLLGEEKEAFQCGRSALDAAGAAIQDRDFLVFDSELALAQILLSSKQPAEASARLSRLREAHRALLTRRPPLLGQLERLMVDADWRSWRLNSQEPAELATLQKRAQGAKDRLVAATAHGTAAPAHVAETLRAFELCQSLELETKNGVLESEVLIEAEAYWNKVHGGGSPTLHGIEWNEARAVFSLLRARSEEARGHRDLAIAHYREAAALEDRLRAGLRYRAPDELSARFETVHDGLTALLLEAAIEHDDPARTKEALDYLEKLRARSLRALLGERRSWNGSVELEAVMPAGRVVLSYTLTPRFAYVIAWRGEEILAARLPKDSTAIERLTTSLRRNMQGAPTTFKVDAVLSDAHLLYQTLLAPVERLLKGAAEMVIVPDGALHDLPFGALLTQSVSRPSGDFDLSGLPFLLFHPGLQSLVSVPSLQTLQLLAANEKSSRSQVVLVGGPELQTQGVPPLPHALAEVTTIASMFPAEERQIFSGKEARKSSLLAAIRTSPRTLHIATHSTRARPRCGSSALLFAPENGEAECGKLDAREVAVLDLRGTELVVLSACASGIGTTAGQEGSIGLPRAFLIAGARSVVASGFEIHDQQTSNLMECFYRRLLEKPPSAARAMWSAMKTLAQNPATSWPGYWSAFFVVGAP